MKPNNVLFIMCDQLRFDYLSCYGHPSLQTPNIDKLAHKGVRFTEAYCASPLCAPSRASFYTGRYPSSHGVLGNGDATRLDEKMMADYLQPLGYRSAVVGKTHSHKSLKEFQTLGLDLTSAYARASQTGGFEPYESHQGLYPDPVLKVNPNQGYTQYLKSKGYDANNPWQHNANSGLDPDGRLHSGWSLRSAPFPAALDEADSETAFTTRRAMDFIDSCDAQPWCLHLSYIKPHWPLIAPAPYHQLYQAEDVKTAVRNESERLNPHPVYQAFMQQEYSQSYARDEIRESVIPTYMGLVKQIDDHLGQLFDFLEKRALTDSTLIVFTADHGDYLGDHWLGEKDLFHQVSAKIPLILMDPRPSADNSRGQTCERLIEAVDILPTVIEFAGASPAIERLEGHSILPILEGNSDPFNREVAISEIDYSDRGVRALLALEPYQCRATMVRYQRWKLIHHQQFEPQLFDLENDPDELIDLGRDPAYASQRQLMKDLLFDWQSNLKRRCGLTYDEARDQAPERDEEWGIIIGRC